MGSDARSVLRNSLVGFGGQLAVLAVNLISSIYIARVLGKDQFGMFSWALALCTVAASVANAGLDNVIVRDIARKRERASDYLLSAFLVKVLTSSICYLGIVLYLQVRGYTGIQLTVGYLLCSTVVAESFNASCRAVLVAMERQDVSAIVSVFTNVIRVGVVVALVFLGYDIVAVACTTVGVGVLTLVAHVVAIRRLAHGGWRPSLGTTRHLVAVGATFLVSEIFLKIFDRADYIMLDIYKDVGSVGIYGAAYRIIDIVSMIAYSCSLALFPVISRKIEDSRGDYARAVFRATKYITIFGIPLCVGIFLLSHQLMVGLYSSKFAASGTCLAILIWSRIAAFAILPGQQSVAARNAQLWLLPPVLARTVVNIALNIYLIPRYGYIGASISMVITENMYFILSYLISFRGPERFNPVELLLRPTLAACVMSAAILLLRPFGIAAATPAAVVVYAVSLWMLGGFDPEDRRILGGLVPAFRRQQA